MFTVLFGLSLLCWHLFRVAGTRTHLMSLVHHRLPTCSTTSSSSSSSSSLLRVAICSVQSCLNLPSFHRSLLTLICPTLLLGLNSSLIPAHCFFFAFFLPTSTSLKRLLGSVFVPCWFRKGPLGLHLPCPQNLLTEPLVGLNPPVFIGLCWRQSVPVGRLYVLIFLCLLSRHVVEVTISQCREKRAWCCWCCWHVSMIVHCKSTFDLTCPFSFLYTYRLYSWKHQSSHPLPIVPHNSCLLPWFLFFFFFPSQHFIYVVVECRQNVCRSPSSVQFTSLFQARTTCEHPHRVWNRSIGHMSCHRHRLSCCQHCRQLSTFYLDNFNSSGFVRGG